MKGRSNRGTWGAAGGAAALVALLALGRAAAVEGGALDAGEILAKCDAFHYPNKMHYKLDVTLEDKDGTKTFMKQEMWQKGVKRLVKFTEPADIAGFSILSKDALTIYVYEPSLKKVRRIASHAKKQSMLGLDFTIDESSTMSLAADYNAALVEETEDSYLLSLSQKEGMDKAWPVLKVHVDKAKFYARTIEYCDAQGAVRKTETRSNLKTFDGRLVTATMKMADHKKKHATTLEVTGAEFTVKIDDELFTKRNLIREE